MSKYLLGIDLGTTNIKGMLIREDGTIIAYSSRKNTLFTPRAGWAEQSAYEWWDNTCSVLSEISLKAGSGIISSVAGIFISSQTITMLPVSSDGTPLRNAIIWMDTRSKDELDRIVEQIGEEEYIRITGAKPDSTFLPGKILWFKENETELFNKTKYILQASSYLNYRLTGEITMDRTQSDLSQCFDINTCQWSDKISAAVGADLKQLLPVPVSFDTIIGTVSAEAASETMLKPGIPVLAGSSDCQASLIASGISRLGEAAESSGTSSMIFVGSETKSVPGMSITTKPSPVPGIPYAFDAPITATGASLKWYLDNPGKNYRAEAENRGIDPFLYVNGIAAKSPAGSRSLLYFPHLQGERAPGWKSYAKGMFIGLTMNTTSEDILRSVFEGTAFEIRYVLESIYSYGPEADSIRITGGGAKSRFWSEVKASMLGIPVLISDSLTGEAPFGDALAAGYAVGLFPELSVTIRELIKIRETIEPRSDWQKVYDRMYPVYLDIFKNLDRDLLRLHEISEQ